MSYIIIYILFTFNFLWLENFVRSNQEVTDLLTLLLTNYDKTVRPSNGGESVKVGVTVYIMNIDSVSEEFMEYSIHLFFRQKWTDSRLAYTSYNKSLNLPGTFSDKLWTPDTFFPNEKSSDSHTISDSNSFIHIKPNGEIMLSTKRAITLACHMDLTYFPMDTQECLLEIESYGFQAKEVSYFWDRGLNDSVGILSTIQLPNYYILGPQIISVIHTLSMGSYSKLEVHLFFVRLISAYFFHVFIPAFLIVLISYMSLWLNIKFSVIRAIIGTTSSISMILITYNPFSSPTKSANTKSLDIYIGVCLFLVFAIVIEFGIIIYLQQKRTINSEEYQAIIQYNNSSKENPSISLDKQDLIMDDENSRLLQIINRIEYFSRIGFLVFFVIFVILYWIIGKSLAKNVNLE